MIKVNIIEDRLQALKGYLALLDTKRDLPFAQILNDLDAYHVILYRLQMACQVAIDISSHILAAGLGKHIVEYREIILALGTEGVFPAEFAKRFAGIAGFRNVLIHEYLIVDPDQVYRLLQTGLDDFRAFAGYVIDYLKKTGAIQDDLYDDYKI
jgi:uncharacterized protein YutE (UPF0331/DUF86 family)